MAVVKYQNDIAKRRAKKGIEGGGWLYTKPFSILDKKIELEDLNGHDKYQFKIGFAPNAKTAEVKTDKDQMIWSDKAKGKTELLTRDEPSPVVDRVAQRTAW
jgi:hypothetical protein